MLSRYHEGKAAIVIGTGPSLAGQAEQIRRLKAAGQVVLFGINNTYEDFELDEWIACDDPNKPNSWHSHYGIARGEFRKWHWDKEYCEQVGYEYIEGRWVDGLSLDPQYISYNHSSGAQALNLAVLMGCEPIYLAGFDMNYTGPQRHYFSGLSDQAGEYPQQIRKNCNFGGLLNCYEQMRPQLDQLPEIVNITPTSALTVFPFGALPNTEA